MFRFTTRTCDLARRWPGILIREGLMAVAHNLFAGTGFHLNSAPKGFNAELELPHGFLEFLRPLHERFTPWQQQLVSARRQAIEAAHRGQLPNFLADS